MMYEPGVVKENIVAADGSKILLQLTAETSFPQNGAVTYTVNPSSAKKFTLAFRIPDWAVNYTLSVNGVKQTSAVPGEISISRVWNKADKIEVLFNMPLQVVQGGPSYPGSIAFKRGPQVLALDSTLNAGYESALPVYYNASATYTATDASSKLPGYWVGRQAYAVTPGNGKPFILVPFADAGQEAAPLQVWIPYTAAGVAFENNKP